MVIDRNRQTQMHRHKRTALSFSQQFAIQCKLKGEGSGKKKVPPFVFNNRRTEKTLLCHSQPFCKSPWRLSSSKVSEQVKNEKRKRQTREGACGISNTVAGWISFWINRCDREDEEIKKRREEVEKRETGKGCLDLFRMKGSNKGERLQISPPY